MSTKPESIRVGNRFQWKDGPVWVVIGTRPGGVVEMKREDKAHFVDRYTRDVREMTRLEGQNQRAIDCARSFL